MRRLRSSGPGRLPPCGVLLVVLWLAGCASTAGDRSPAGAVKKPFVPPAWESVEFRSDDGAFLVHYPADFQEQAPQGPGALLSVASPSLVPRVDVRRLDAEEDPTLDGMGAALETSLAETGGGEAEVTSSDSVVLRDGVTSALRYTVDWTFQGFPLSSVVLVAPAGGYHVSVMVTGMEGADLAELDDIAYTLTVD